MKEKTVALKNVSFLYVYAILEEGRCSEVEVRIRVAGTEELVAHHHNAPFLLPLVELRFSSKIQDS